PDLELGIPEGVADPLAEYRVFVAPGVTDEGPSRPPRVTEEVRQVGGAAEAFLAAAVGHPGGQSGDRGEESPHEALGVVAQGGEVPVADPDDKAGEPVVGRKDAAHPALTGIELDALGVESAPIGVVVARQRSDDVVLGGSDG